MVDVGDEEYRRMGSTWPNNFFQRMKRLDIRCSKILLWPRKKYICMAVFFSQRESKRNGLPEQSIWKIFSIKNIQPILNDLLISEKFMHELVHFQKAMAIDEINNENLSIDKRTHIFYSIKKILMNWLMLCQTVVQQGIKYTKLSMSCKEAENQWPWNGQY